MAARRGGIQPRMDSREINVAPDKFEVALGAMYCWSPSCARRSRFACTTPRRRPARCCTCAASCAAAKPADVTDTTLATELLLLDRCLAALREACPGGPPPAGAHRGAPGRLRRQAAAMCETMVALVKRYLEDGGVRLLPEDIAAGPGARVCASGPSMGWVHTRA